jgi:hypothetical protein
MTDGWVDRIGRAILVTNDLRLMVGLTGLAKCFDQVREVVDG